MTAKRIIGIIALVAIGGIGLFIFFLYATIKTKSTNIDTYEPFKEWVGKTVTLDKETVAFEEKVRMTPNSKYPYMLLDSLHPDWEYVWNQEKRGTVTRIKTFPTGTKLMLEKAIQYTNGVSGSSYPTIFGTIKDGKNEYKVGYPWGEINVSRDFKGIAESWRFHRAPWQTAEDTTYYALPRAKWW